MLEKIKNMPTEELLRLKELLEAKNVRRGRNSATSTAKEQAEPQEFIFYQIHDPTAFLEEHFFTAWIDQTNGIQGIYGRLRENPENPQLMALMFMKAKEWTLEKVNDWLNNHPQYLRTSSEPIAMVGIQQTRQFGGRKSLGEAIISSSEPSPYDLISKKEVLKLLPEDWIVRAWSYGPQLLVRQLRHKLESRSSETVTGSR